MVLRVEPNAEPIPGYRLIERLGGGGFGEVWRAEVPGGMHKAIKFVFGDLSSAGDNGQRAEQELKALSRVKTVRHPYILSLERYDIIDGRLMIVMELADRNLWDRFKESRTQGLPGIPREELLRYMEEVAEALDLMNSEHQLQHLDIKPQNLFLVHQHVKVADFGLVKDLEGSQALVTGGVTPVYAAPETFDGRVTRFSDQYSLAIVYQELLTGQRPFAGTNVRQLILQHLQGVPDVSPLPPGDQAAILRALSKTPSERFPCCRDLVYGLRSSGHSVAKAPVPDGYQQPGESRSLADQSALLSARSGLSASALAPKPTAPGTEPPGEWPARGAPSVPGGSWPGTGPPTPNLRGPQGETGSHNGTTQFIRGYDPGVVKLAEATETLKAQPEVTGPGTLFPAIVIGLGQMGMNVLQRTREFLHNQVAPLNQLPCIRMLLLDTDPEAMRSAARSRPEVSFAASDVLLAPLNRPSYYLKPRDGRPSLDSWFNPRMLYRIPRSQVTTGVRALGRLAFLDNYRSIVRRLQLELELALDPSALQNAVRQTKLGIRTNRPRVYIVTSLAGGSGSGMFLDLAYTIRALLRQLGYDPPDVVGLLLLPPVDRNRTKVLTLGNTYAALSELAYYSSPGTLFTSRYHEREGAIQDSNPPFSRYMILPLPDETDEVATQELVDLSGQFLARDLTSPLGRAADLGRAGLTAPPWDMRGLYFNTFGLFQLSWPRHALLDAVARKLCQRLVQKWMSKDAKPFRGIVQEWVQQQWMRLGLSADNFIQRLQTELTRLNGRSPESNFASIIDSLSKLSADNGAQGSRSSETKPPPPEQVRAILTELEALVSTPDDDGLSDSTGELVRLLRTAAEQLVSEWSQKLAELPVHLIEDPSFRLAGAEEVIRQLVVTIEQTLQHHEPLSQELARKAAEAYERLRILASPPKPGQRRPVASVADVLDLLRAYPKWRFQSLVLNHLASTFVGLRGHLSDELREVNFCRVRLSELLRMLEETPASAARRSWPGVGLRPEGISHKLFMNGCKTLEEAIAQFLDGITPEHLFELDEKIEETIRKRFTALVHVCLTSSNVLKQVQNALLETARQYAASCLPPTSVAEMFFEQTPEPAQAEAEVASFYDEAAPELSANDRSPRGGPSVAELCVLASPEDVSSRRFRTTLHQAMPEVEMVEASSKDDIVIYRERTNLALQDLEQLGPLGEDAYRQMTVTDNFTPHTRLDVDFTGHRE